MGQSYLWQLECVMYDAYNSLFFPLYHGKETKAKSLVYLFGQYKLNPKDDVITCF